MNWTEYHVTFTSHNRRIAKADATGRIWPRGAARPLRVRLSTALIALGLRQALETGTAARNHTAARSA